MKRIALLLPALAVLTLNVAHAAPKAGYSQQREALVACYNPETKRLEPCF